MKNNYRKWTNILTILGTVPFLFYLYMKLRYDQVCECFKLEYLKVYSMMLIAFISGYIWAYAYQTKSVRLALLAVIGSIIPLINFIFNHGDNYFVVDMVYYVILLFVEGEKYDEHQTSKWYYKLRILATSIVVLSLIGITYF